MINMAKRKKMAQNEFIGPTIGIVSGATILGIGGSAAVKAGGSAAGMTAMSSFLPSIGGVMGAGLTLRQVKKLEKVSKKRK